MTYDRKFYLRKYDKRIFAVFYSLIGVKTTFLHKYTNRRQADCGYKSRARYVTFGS